MKEKGSDCVMWSYSYVGGGCVLLPSHYFFLHSFCEGESLNRTVKAERPSQNPNNVLYVLSSFSSSIWLSLLYTEQRMVWAGCEENKRQENDRGFPCIQITAWELVVLGSNEKLYKSKSYYEYSIRAYLLGCSQSVQVRYSHEFLHIMRILQ